MAVVYKAADERSGAVVAVKMLRGDIANSRADERLMQEATLGARLDHPNCVGVIDSGQADGRGPYLVMEFVDGRSLRDHIADVGVLPWRDALAIAAHVLRGLAHAHDCGLLHRDIKPENIVLAARDDDPHFARLIDFGISKVLEGSGVDLNLTGTGFIIGTPRYLAPEQAVGGTIGPATDLYAVTCVLFELLTGQTPFDGTDLVQIVTAHAMTPPPDPRELRPDLEIPEPVANLIEIGLRKRADERPPSAAAYLADIEQLLGRGEAASSQPDLSHQPAGALPPEVFPPSVGSPSPDGALTTALNSLSIEELPPEVSPPSVGSSSAGSNALPAGASQPDREPPPAGELQLDRTSPGISLSHAVSSPPLSAPPVATDVSTAATIAAPRVRARSRHRWELIALIGAAVGIFVAIVTTSGGRPPLAPPVQRAPLVVTAPPPDRELLLKAGLHDLVNGRTCAERQVAVEALRRLGDKRAVPALKKARMRIRGGFFGLGSQNTNQCLRAAAEAAVRDLDPDALPSSRARK